MKCLIINGSASKAYPFNGKLIESFSAQLVGHVRAEMARMGEVSFEELYLCDLALPYCKGCYNCFFKGEGSCPHTAVYQPVMEKIREADCLIITSPVYALNVSALVKCFYDLGAYNHHRPQFHTKKALTVSSTMGGYAKKACKYMRDELMHWGFNCVYTLPAVRMGAAEPTPKMTTACQKAARRLYTDTASGKLHSPSLRRVFFYQLWRVMSKNDKASADYAYWHNNGFAQREFAPGVKLGMGKRLFGKALKGLLGKAMKIKE